MKRISSSLSKRIFISVSTALVIIGLAMITSCLTGGRQYAAGGATFVGGFTTTALGLFLLTRDPIMVFFYLCYTIAFAIVQLPKDGIVSLSGIYTLILLMVGVVLLKCLPKKRRKR